HLCCRNAAAPFADTRSRLAPPGNTSELAHKLSFVSFVVSRQRLSALRNFPYSSRSKPNVTFEPLMRIGRRIRFGFSIIRSIASFFDFGSGRCFQTGLRVLTKSRNRSASTCCSRNSRDGGSLLMSRSCTCTPACSRKLLAFLHVVQVGFQ